MCYIYICVCVCVCVVLKLATRRLLVKVNEPALDLPALVRLLGQFFFTSAGKSNAGEGIELKMKYGEGIKLAVTCSHIGNSLIGCKCKKISGQRR